MNVGDKVMFNINGEDYRPATGEVVGVTSGDAADVRVTGVTRDEDRDCVGKVWTLPNDMLTVN